MLRATMKRWRLLCGTSSALGMLRATMKPAESRRDANRALKMRETLKRDVAGG
jgi:hypothetical protein